MNRPRRNFKSYDGAPQPNFVPGVNPQYHMQPPPNPTKPEPPSTPVRVAVKPEPASPAPTLAPPPPTVAPSENDLKVSAITKALDKTERPWKKGVRAPKAVRQRKANSMLAKVISPKSPAVLLNQMMPEAEIITRPIGKDTFEGVVVSGNKEWGSAQAPSKAAAKARAAELAIKKLIGERLNQETKSPPPSNNGDVSMEEDEPPESPSDNIPWASLASYAIFKLFEDWEAEGVPIPQKESTKPMKPPKIPENPTSIHPSMLLNQLRPGLIPIPLQSTKTPNSSFTLGYQIDGQCTLELLQTKRLLGRKPQNLF